MATRLLENSLSMIKTGAPSAGERGEGGRRGGRGGGRRGEGGGRREGGRERGGGREGGRGILTLPLTLSVITVLEEADQPISLLQ